MIHHFGCWVILLQVNSSGACCSSVECQHFWKKNNCKKKKKKNRFHEQKWSTVSSKCTPCVSTGAAYLSWRCLKTNFVIEQSFTTQPRAWARGEINFTEPTSFVKPHSLLSKKKKTLVHRSRSPLVWNPGYHINTRAFISVLVTSHLIAPEKQEAGAANGRSEKWI